MSVRGGPLLPECRFRRASEISHRRVREFLGPHNGVQKCTDAEEWLSQTQPDAGCGRWMLAGQRRVKGHVDHAPPPLAVLPLTFGRGDRSHHRGRDLVRAPASGVEIDVGRWEQVAELCESGVRVADELRVPRDASCRVALDTGDGNLGIDPKPDVMDHHPWPLCFPEDLEPVGFKERTVCDHHIDTRIEPRPDESSGGDCGASPELLQIVSTALHECDVVHVDISSGHTGPPHELHDSGSDRALPGADRPDHDNQMSHELLGGPRGQSANCRIASVTRSRSSIESCNSAMQRVAKFLLASPAVRPVTVRSDQGSLATNPSAVSVIRDAR